MLRDNEVGEVETFDLVNQHAGTLVVRVVRNEETC